MALLLTILGFGLFIFAIRTVNRWDGGRIPIQVHVMIGIVGVVVLLMGLYPLTAPQVPKSIPSDISLRAGDPVRDRRSLRAGHHEPDRAQIGRHGPPLHPGWFPVPGECRSPRRAVSLGFGNVYLSNPRIARLDPTQAVSELRPASRPALRYHLLI
jgi:hypothetical protein